MKKVFKAVRPRFVTDEYLLQDVMHIPDGDNLDKMHWRRYYKKHLEEDVLRYIWMSPSIFPKDRRDCARAIVAGRTSAKKSRGNGTSVVLNMRIAESLAVEIKQACDKLAMSKSDFVRMAIENELDDKLGNLSDD